MFCWIDFTGCLNTQLCFASYHPGQSKMTSIIGPRQEKTCLRGFAKNTFADQPAHPRSLISAFVICVSVQRLCYLRFGKYHIQACYKRNFIFLASFCSWAGCFESHFVGNPEDRFVATRPNYVIALLWASFFNSQSNPTSYEILWSRLKARLIKGKYRNHFIFVQSFLVDIKDGMSMLELLIVSSGSWLKSKWFLRVPLISFADICLPISAIKIIFLTDLWNE